MVSEPSSPSLSGLRPTRRRSLPHDVADQLIELIASSTGGEVALPPERRLCEQLSVSRNVLREALSALDHQGVVETRGKARVGVTARARAALVARVPSGGPERELVLDPIEVRRMLEPEAAALAAQRAGEDAIGELERWLGRMKEGVARGERVVEYDSAFHVAIAQATGNHTLVALIGALTDALRDSRERSFTPDGAAEAAIDDHRAIVTAIRARDAPAAEQAMRAHLARVEDLIRASLAQAPPGPGRG
jgi:DNA-binding FadR family transcriptional regulator